MTSITGFLSDTAFRAQAQSKKTLSLRVLPAARKTLSDRVRGPAVWIATCGGVGYLPIAPGTAGSVVAVAVTAALGVLPQTVPWLRLLLVGAAAVVLFIGIWTSTRAEAFFGKTDPHEVVIDEVAGQFLTLAAIPQVTWKWLALGFLLFRLLDIVKPFPARRAERLPGGWGIMIDDMIAGVYGAATIFATGHLIR